MPLPVSPSSTIAVRIWDLPTRLFHWALAALAIAAIASGMAGDAWMEWHLRLGQGVLALVLFRLVWGVVGGRWSRFGNFVCPPARIAAYLRGQGSASDETGHSPTGALSVLAMLLLLLVQGGLGLFANDDIAYSGPLTHLVSTDMVEKLTSWHKMGKNILIALLLLHVAAIVYYRLKGRNLVTPMLTGDKPLPADTPASTDNWRSRLLALCIFAACAALMVWINSLGAVAALAGNG